MSLLVTGSDRTAKNAWALGAPDARGPQPSARPPWRRILVGESEAIQRVAEIIRLVASKRCTVLITGETGTGKEVAARALHQAGPRAAKPFVAINCGALPEHLLEAELFGHVKGAFTGAVNNRVGRIEQAGQGTLFLDEISEMSLDLQAKLLRILQEREFQRLGSSETVRADVRFVAASNAALLERVHQNRFREDLYYRLNVVPLEIPPLRERVSDIPLLVRHFAEKICGFEQIPIRSVKAEALDLLCRQSWPGNVRQLENAVEMAIALSGDRTELGAEDFAFGGFEPVSRPAEPNAGTWPLIRLPDEGLDYEGLIGRIELSLLSQALEKTRGNKKMAAELLRLKRTTLTAKLKTLEARAS